MNKHEKAYYMKLFRSHIFQFYVLYSIYIHLKRRLDIGKTSIIAYHGFGEKRGEGIAMCPLMTFYAFCDSEDRSKHMPALPSLSFIFFMNEE